MGYWRADISERRAVHGFALYVLIGGHLSWRMCVCYHVNCERIRGALIVGVLAHGTGTAWWGP